MFIDTFQRICEFARYPHQTYIYTSAGKYAGKLIVTNAAGTDRKSGATSSMSRAV
ncbi:MAG: hypothetical protein M0Q92_03065 [Methanoregula sp.]|nr:hypothetical protein [Methanoregula sp.]